MSNIIKFWGLVVILCGAIWIGSHHPFQSPKVIPVATPHVILPKLRGHLASFLKAIGHTEGLDKYSTVSNNHMLGKYQFAPSTLRVVGYTGEAQEFLNDSALQDSLMIVLLHRNNRALADIIHHYAGTTYRGIYITRSGLLASAHLVGICGVHAFFDSTFACPTRDGNGMTMNRYLVKFANYNLGGM